SGSNWDFPQTHPAQNHLHNVAPPAPYINVRTNQPLADPSSSARSGNNRSYSARESPDHSIRDRESIFRRDHAEPSNPDRPRPARPPSSASPPANPNRLKTSCSSSRASHKPCSQSSRAQKMPASSSSVPDR